jgi:hypothetical protein
MTAGEDRAEAALAAARRLLAERFPEAGCGFASGSIMRGHGTPTSDIDFVVVHRRVDRGWRESLTWEGFPVEVWAHDPETLAWFMEKDAESGWPIMAHMVTTGRPIGPDLDLAATVRERAEAVLAKGPQSLDSEFGRSLRYMVTALLEDLDDAPDDAARRAVVAMLYQPLADLMLIGRGKWSGKGKWVPRRLRACDPALAEAFDAAVRDASAGDAGPLLALGDGELMRHGGRYFDGDKRLAPREARLKLSDP